MSGYYIAGGIYTDKQCDNHQCIHNLCEVTKSWGPRICDHINPKPSFSACVVCLSLPMKVNECPTLGSALSPHTPFLPLNPPTLCTFFPCYIYIFKNDLGWSQEALGFFPLHLFYSSGSPLLMLWHDDISSTLYFIGRCADALHSISSVFQVEWHWMHIPRGRRLWVDSQWPVNGAGAHHWGPVTLRRGSRALNAIREENDCAGPRHLSSKS